jgi:hypothetical protein
MGQWGENAVAKERVGAKISPNQTTQVIGQNNGFQKAPGDIIWQNDFSTAGDWTIASTQIGGDWQVLTSSSADISTYMGDMASTTAANGFGEFNGISALLAGSVDFQDATLTYTGGTIDCSAAAAVTLEFELRQRAFNSDEQWVEFSTDGGTSWQGLDVNLAVVTNAPATQDMVVLDVSAYCAGAANVMIRFHWICASDDDQYGSGYGWSVDDVYLKESANNDIEVAKTWALTGPAVIDYSIQAYTQISPMNYSAQVINKGAAAQPNTILTASEATQGYVGVSAMGNSLAPTATDSIYTTTDFTAPAGISAIYTIDLVVTSDSVDTNPTDNVGQHTLQVEEFIYARDMGLLDGSAVSNGVSNWSGGTGSSFKIGNVFEIIGNDIIHAIDVVVDPGQDVTNNPALYAEIYIYDAGTQDYVYVEQTNDLFLTASDVGVVLSLSLFSPVTVTAGEIYLVVAGHYGGPATGDDDISIGYAGQTEQGTVLGYDGGNSLVSLISPIIPAVRINFNDAVGVIENVAGAQLGQNMPNPANGTTTIPYSLETAAAVSMKIVDVTGKVVFTSVEGTVSAGEHTIVMDAANFNSGVYFYTLTVGGHTMTKRMMVTK